VEGIERYLASGMMRGIGPIYAKRLVWAFGEAVLDLIEQQPARLREVTGIGAKRAARIIAGWAEQKVIREIMLFLHANGVSTWRAVRIYKTYGNEAVRVISENPYRLARADDRQRARVLGLNGSLLSGGFTAGALAGGMLVGVLSWRWAFLINVPVALVVLALTPFVVPAGRSPANVRLDVPGAASVTLGLFAVAFGITEQFVPALVAGPVLLALFFWIERRATSPLVAVEMLALPSVRWGNLAALTIFSMEAGLVFLTTLYLQNVLHFGPLTTGLIFGVPGLASVAAGVIAGQIISRRGARIILLAALLIQGGLTAPMILLGTQPTWLWLLIPALFGGFFGHITAVVAATVTATSEVPDAQKGLATGLVTTSQRVAVTVGIPVLGAVMAIPSDLLAGIHLALTANVLLTLTAMAMISTGLNRLRPAGTHPASIP
jgi:MFS family permease